MTQKRKMTTAPFRDAVEKDYFTMQRGENGFPEYTALGVGSNVLAISQMVRGGDPTSLVDEVLARGSPQDLVDLVILIFVTRNTRGGKGEKDLSYKIFVRVWKDYPATASQLLPLFARYGYWKDLLKLMAIGKGDPDARGLGKAALHVMTKQFLKDVAALDEYEAKLADAKGDEVKVEALRKEGPALSLLAKWLPRERSKFDKEVNFVNRFVKVVWSETSAENTVVWQSSAKTRYRKVVAKLTSFFGLPEVFLSMERANEIEFHKVASKATLRLTKAFLNEDRHGNVRSNDPKRIRMAEMFIEHLTRFGAKGGQVMPHEIVGKILKAGKMSRSQELVLDAQWKDLVKNVVEQVKAKAESEGLDFNPTRMVPLSDVSGSMYGVPMEVSIALGILISEITHEAFRGLVLTFETNPRWHRLVPTDSIVEKVRSLSRAPWGGSTDFVKAYRQIFEICKEHRLAREDVPLLIVFSDMQFNEAAGCVYQYWRGGQTKTMEDIQQRINRDFAETGRKLGWKDLDPKPTVYWNLRNTGGHPVNKDTEGAVLLAGFSPSLLKLVMNGEALKEETVEVVDSHGNTTTEKVRVTPEQILRKMLDDELYDPVREVLVRSQEGVLQEYGPKEVVTSGDDEDDEFELV